MKLIGINGLKTSGKDSTYQAIKAALPEKKVKRVAFADNLKQAAALAIGYEMLEEGETTEIEAMDQCKEGWRFTVVDHQDGSHLASFTGREYLQWFGQAMRRVFGDSFWIDQVLPQQEWGLDDHGFPGVDVLCVTDVRYPNEAERIKDLGGEVWEVIRPGLESDGHSSEIPLADDLVDVKILNDGTIDDLYKKVHDVLYSLV